MLSLFFCVIIRFFCYGRHFQQILLEECKYVMKNKNKINAINEELR